MDFLDYTVPPMFYDPLSDAKFKYNDYILPGTVEFFKAKHGSYFDDDIYYLMSASFFKNKALDELLKKYATIL